MDLSYDYTSTVELTPSIAISNACYNPTYTSYASVYSSSATELAEELKNTLDSYLSFEKIAEEAKGKIKSCGLQEEDKTLRNKYENDQQFTIRRVKEIIPDRVFEFTVKDPWSFSKEITIKTVCDLEDEPNLEYACALALAKYLYNHYTFETIIKYIIPFHIFGNKNFLKEIKHAVKIIKENRRIAQIKKEKEEIKARQKARRVRQKQKRAERKKNNQIDIIKEAILASKNEG